METTLAALMVLGIFVGVPLVAGLALAGIHIVAGKRAEKTEQHIEETNKIYAKVD